jgi:indole-3-glycerol phosphate synthase
MILDQIVQTSTLRAATLPYTRDCQFQNLSAARDYSGHQVISLRKAVTGVKNKNAIIAEMKSASPSRGHLRTLSNPPDIAKELISGGCCALSIITEPTYFHGDPSTIPMIRDTVPIPILRKDFIVDPRQLIETRQLGADAVLLITAVLGDHLSEFVDAAKRLGLEPLVEVHSMKEVRTALDSGADLIGVNNRNLKTLKTDISTTCRLAPCIRQAGRTVIAESGVTWPCDIRTLRSCAHGYLIGSSIMAADNPRKKLEGFVFA